MTQGELFAIITDKNFKKEVLDNAGPVMVEVGADWCGACHIMAPIIEKLAFRYKGRIKIGKVDIDKNKKVAREYGVNELPLLLFFNNGRIVDHVIGPVSTDALEARLKELLQTETKQKEDPNEKTT
jgi:thioredoxin 1